MRHIGLLSDTHHCHGEDIKEALSDCDEIWHAGDFGSAVVAEKLNEISPLKGVFGNIDGQDIRVDFGETATFSVLGLKVAMIHIGGYPGKYTAKAKQLIQSYKPDLFISGHSHILKIMPDDQNQLLHINPGAAGHQGFHQMRTLVKFAISNQKIKDLRVIELGKRGKIHQNSST